MRSQIIAFCFVLCCQTTGSGNVHHVPAEYVTIQAGIDAAIEGDTVIVADGTYNGAGNKNLDYQGKSIHVMSKNGAEQTIIDCGNDGRGFHFHNNEDSLAIVEGFTIKNGYITAAWPENKGGGIFCDAASPTILNCIITENTCEGFVGGVYCSDSGASIIGCTVNRNTAPYSAGGIYNGKYVLNSDISENSGAGLSIGNTLLVSSCTINNNTGVGIEANGYLTISDCTISGNTDTYGGGIHVVFGEPTVMDCLIFGNTAVRGGGVYCSWGDISLVDCIIAGNVGSGIYSFEYPDITNCTIVGNSAYGVKCVGSYAYATIVNCIFWDNASQEIDDDNGRSEVDYSTVQGTIWPGIGNLKSNPRFVDPRNGDFRLLPESPCIDAGDPSFTPRPGGGRRIDMGAIEHFLGFNFRKGAMSQTRRVPQDYPTIQEAIDAAVYLDTILVADGTYTGEGNKNIEFLGKTIIVQSENGPEATVIDCENDGRGFNFQDYETPETKLQGFTVTNGNLYGDGGGVRCYYSSPSILDCRIINCVTLRDGGGVYCAFTDAIIADCLIADNMADGYGGGLEFYDRYDEHFFQVYNSIFVSNEASDIGGGIYGGSPSSITNCTVYGNTANQGYGLACDSRFLTVSNSIFRDDETSEIFFYEYEEPTITFSNILGGWEGEGNIDADPLFVDPGNGDFHLTIDSPCIDAGTLAGAPEFDFEGDPRPLGDGVDMGADEYTGKYLVELLSAFRQAPVTIKR